MRSHKENSQIIHKCTECDLSFGKRDELVAHSSLHATENLVCPLCKTTFESVDDVSEHIKQHTEGEQFACEFCDLIFLTESELHEHSDTQHLEEIELYDMANTNEESLDDGIEYAPIKSESNEIIEYTEQVEVISPEELSPEVSKPKPASRSYGKANAKPIVKSVKPIIKSEESSSNTTNTTIRSPNTRASVTKTASATIEKTPEKAVSTRSSKVSPNKSISPEKTALVVTTTTSVAPTKKVTSQTSLTKFLTIKSKTTEQSDTNTPTLKKLIPLPTLKTINKDDDKVTTTKVGNKLVKVKQIRMTKSQIEALTKEGKIEMRGNQVIIKKPNPAKKK